MSSASGGRALRPWLWMPSKLAHDLSPYFLPVISHLAPKVDNNWSSFEYKKLRFSNPLGIAGGVDKTGASLASWKRLGAGFLEVGTVTPEKQGPNPGRIMDRDVGRQALWNKMGFPNAGADLIANRLQSFDKGKTPLFVNIGRNRWTENSKAYLDYATCIQKLNPFADAFVVNVSSPNTKGLRDLLSESELKSFLDALFNESKGIAAGKPFLLKLSPDMNEETLRMALEVSQHYVDGWILTNTTKQRYSGSFFPSDQGGVSGLPLKELSREALKIAADFKKQTSGEKLLVSVGGIGDEQEIMTRLEMGADLVQFYSSLVFEGPFFFHKKIKSLRIGQNL